MKLKILRDIRKVFKPFGLIRIWSILKKGKNVPMTTYPQALPIECAQTMIRIIRDREVQTKRVEFAHCAWQVQGYVQKVLIGEPSDARQSDLFSMTPDDGSLDETLYSLETELNALEGSSAPTASNEGFGASPPTEDQASLDPATILLIVNTIGPMLIKLLQNLRERRKAK